MSKKMRVEVFRDTASDWRWRIKASNGKIVATSGEGYKRKNSCVTMAQKLCAEFELVEVEA